MPPPARKAFPLRLDPALHAAVERLAAAELRSVNAQIEYLLREALRTRGIRTNDAEKDEGASAGLWPASVHRSRSITSVSTTVCGP
ncbi:MAG: hypothetical protein FD160_1354 [Caulobacteraceae bacterium]|nr:MAG: hypothetical protein FD160_1354 [Caulobacteraceae bacterium]